MKKYILFFAILFVASDKINAQISKVNLQASGLTCSMCSNAINKALKSIDYVDKVVANIKNSSFEISFKPNSNINFDQLKKKVEDAGFFVAKFEIVLSVNSISISNDAHVDIYGTMFHFLNVGNKVIDGGTTIQLLDKGFVTSKEFKKNSKYTKMDCYQTGIMGSCCTDKSKSSGTRIYHVTI